MEKIKNNIFFGKIQSIIFKTPIASAKFRLNIAKNIFILVAFLYFFSLLMTLSGFITNITAMLTFFLYPVFVFFTLALIYSIIVYNLVVYAEKLLFLSYGIFLGLCVVYVILIALYLGAYPFILSLLGKN